MNTRIKQLLVAGLLLPISQIFGGWYPSETGDFDPEYNAGSYAHVGLDESGTMASCESFYGYVGSSWSAYMDYEVNKMHKVNGQLGWNGQTYGTCVVASTYGAHSSTQYWSLGALTWDIYGHCFAEALQ